MVKTAVPTGDSDDFERKLTEAFGVPGPVVPETPEVSIERGGIGFPAVGPFGRLQPMIWTLLSRAMNEVTAVGKTGFNEQQKYNFRGVDDVINALGPALRKHGVIPVPKLKKASYRDTLTTGQRTPTRETTVEVVYRFTAPDGSFAKVKVPGESLDQSDKGSAKAMSVAYRIALIQLFCLPTSEPDPDSHYHTRSGMGAMAATVATLIGEKLPTADVYELYRFWPIIEEHAAADRPFSGAPDSPTWLQAFAARYAELIEQIETVEEGRDFVAAMIPGSPAWSVGDTTLKHLTLARGRFVKERKEKTFDHCMGQITAAEDRAALDTATGCALAAQEARVLDEEQMSQLMTVAHERYAKLPEEDLDAALDAIATEEEAPTTSGDPELFKPAEGHAWDVFASAADLSHLGFSHINDLITNESEIFDAPAAEWGTAGLQRVQDAITRSHVRDETITRDEREELERRLRHYAAGVGITWPIP